MKQSVSYVAIALILLAGWLVQLPAQANGSANKSTSNSKAGNGSEKQQPAPDAVEVKLASLESMNLYRSVFYGSRLRPQNRYPQRAPIAGTLEDIAVSAGQQVSRGQLLGSVRRDLSGRNYKSVEIIADHSGTVAHYELRPGDPVQEKQDILTILDTSALLGEIWVSDKDITSVRPGDTAVVFESSEPTDIRGRVAAVPPEPDYESGLFKVEVEFRPQPGLFIGKFLRIELRKEPYRGLAVPSEHIQRKYGKDHLFIVSDGVVELREVQTGASYDELVAITGGAEAGEQYVVSAGQRIGDGTPVKIAEGGE
ncbi:MAG: efflux RND transporter periplasmic adaptor subunit [Spirochaetia bacterium]|nr:efflux RND transporter periplasmic adaptor subunit [Spirochaetia bacterium]